MSAAAASSRLREVVAEHTVIRWARRYELAGVLTWLIVGVGWLTDPLAGASSPVGQSVDPLDTVWAVFYVVGALAAIAGRWKENAGWRAAGFALLTAGLMMQGTAAIGANGFQVRDLGYFVWAIAFGTHLRWLFRTYRLVPSDD